MTKICGVDMGEGFICNIQQGHMGGHVHCRVDAPAVFESKPEVAVMTKSTAAQDEAFVRGVWAWVQVRLAEPFEGMIANKWIVRFPVHGIIGGFESEAEAWSDAAEYTRERQEEIRQLDREIELISAEYETFISLSLRSFFGSAVFPRCAATYGRILTRLTEARDVLKRGMR